MLWSWGRGGVLGFEVGGLGLGLDVEGLGVGGGCG